MSSCSVNKRIHLSMEEQSSMAGFARSIWQCKSDMDGLVPLVIRLQPDTCEHMPVQAGGIHVLEHGLRRAHQQLRDAH